MLMNVHCGHLRLRRYNYFKIAPRETSGPEAKPGLRPRLQVSSAASREGGSRGH